MYIALSAWAGTLVIARGDADTEPNWRFTSRLCATGVELLVANLLHLVFQLLCHGPHSFPIAGVVIAVEQFPRIFLAIEQLPLPFFAARSRSRQAEVFVVPVNQLVPLVPDAVVGVRVVDDVSVHPVAVVCHLLPVAR